MCSQLQFQRLVSLGLLIGCLSSALFPSGYRCQAVGGTDSALALGASDCRCFYDKSCGKCFCQCGS